MTTDTELAEITKLVRKYCDSCSLADDLQTDTQNKLSALDGHELYKAINAILADRDAARSGIEAQADALTRLRAENEGLRAEMNLQNTCVACSAALWPNEQVPHCEDCVATEDQEADFREALASLQSSEGRS